METEAKPSMRACTTGYFGGCAQWYTGGWLNPTWPVVYPWTAEANPARTDAPPNALRFLVIDIGVIRSIPNAHCWMETTRARGGESGVVHASCVLVGTLRKCGDVATDMQVQHNLTTLLTIR